MGNLLPRQSTSTQWCPMPEHGIRSPYSKCPFEVRILDEVGTGLGTGSAFFYEIDERLFLITNWHIVSGRHFLSKKSLMHDGRHPARLQVKLFSTGLEAVGSDTLSIRAYDVSIFENGEPVWFEHPALESSCDVVALPMERPQACPHFMHDAANRISGHRIPVLPGSTVFVIGFPRSISVGPGLPVWKSGYVASEPYYDVTIGGQASEHGGLHGGYRLPAFFIDSQTREGMSGSPVFALYVGNWNAADPYHWDSEDPAFLTRADTMLGSRGMEFVGCYSGRTMPKEEGAALGLCWRKDVIEQICRAQKKGRHPHNPAGVTAPQGTGAPLWSDNGPFG